MTAAFDGRVLGACAGSFVLAWLLIRASLVYARRRGLFDQPGQRRSHAVATPRGAGVGLLLGASPGVAWALSGALGERLGGADAAVAILAIVLVAATGWRDDHASLRAAPRALVHLIAGVLTAWAVFHASAWTPLHVGLAVALLVAVTWSINLHNFMDGADTLLGLQALFFFAALGGVAQWLGHAGLAAAMWCVAAASLAFLWFNRAPARIFMGDVGSGTIGLLVALAAALLWQREPQTLAAALILCSAFVVDASLTLASRMLRGRRWYTAHREHLYQWLIRCGFGHARTGMLYMLWNLAVTVPCACAATVWPRAAVPLCVGVYIAGALVWVSGKRACLARCKGASARAA